MADEDDDALREKRRAVAEKLVGCFGKIATARKLPKHEQEAAHAEVARRLAKLPRKPWVLDVVAEMLVEKPTRRRAEVHILAGLSDIDGAAVRIRARLEDPDADVRSTVIQTILHAGWLHLAPELAQRLARESDPHCRRYTLIVCGTSRSPQVVPQLLATAQADLAGAHGDRGSLLHALRLHGTTEARSYLEAIVELVPPSPRPRFDKTNEHRVLAAWALCALGPHQAAHALLVAMLDDPPITHTWSGGGGREPGVSQLAARALLGLLRLPSPTGDAVAEVKAHLARRA